MDKKQGQLRHARRRARERYGLHLTDDQVRSIANRIKDGEAQVLRRPTCRIWIYRVHWQRRDLIAAYDRKRQTIASFLPPNGREASL